VLQVPCIGQQGSADFLGIGPSFPLARGLCKYFANAGGKQLIQCQLLVAQYKQQANPLLSMLNYTLLVISRNDKNKQLTIIKPTQTSFNHEKFTFGNIKSLEHLTNLKNVPVLYLGLTNHTCYQKSNPSRETVPLKNILCLNVHIYRPFV
jgi:hypothetical protein